MSGAMVHCDDTSNSASLDEGACHSRSSSSPNPPESTPPTKREWHEGMRIDWGMQLYVYAALSRVAKLITLK